MTSQRHFVKLCMAVGLIATLLAGCTTTGHVSSSLDTSGNPAVDEWPALVEAAKRRGKLLAPLAAKAAPAEAAKFYLRAADMFLIAGRMDLANNQISDVAGFELSSIDTARLNMLRSRLADVQSVRAKKGRSASDVSRSLASRAEQLKLANYRVGALRLRVKRNLLLTDAKEQQANDIAIWELVNTFNADELATLPALGSDELVSWWSLGYVYKTRKGASLPAAIAWWKKHYPGHAESNTVVAMLLADAAVGLAGGPSSGANSAGLVLSQNPDNVALILPTQGRYGAAAKAIRAGFEAADSSSLAPILAVKYFDPDKEGVLAAYDKAIAAGAKLVIGPLQKPAVTQLAAEGAISAPVLALNSVPGIPLPAGFIMFGLVPEQEARQVARRAIGDGKRRAAVLVPVNDWGARLAAAFSDEYTKLGGTVVASGDYRPLVNDLGRDVQRLLQSNTREPLWRDIGSFESANRSTYEKNANAFRWRRSDQKIDMIFVAAFPRDARILRPSLQFHHAIRLPVYATSHSYSGRPNPRFDADLNGVIFCDMPGLLQPAVEPDALSGEAVVDAGLRHYPQRLVALGQDARLLVDNLALLQSNPGFQVEGATGRLSLDDSQVVRELSCAQFIDGRAVLLAPVGSPAAGLAIETMNVQQQGTTLPPREAPLPPVTPNNTRRSL